MLKKFLLLVSLLGLSISGTVQAEAPLSIPRLKAKVTIDGKLNEPIWKQGTRITLDYETRPGENIKPEVETEVFLYEDGKTLYVAFVAHDPNPEEIRAYYRDRDKAYSDDMVGIVLDTYNDETRSFEFFVNALGAQMDMINNEAGGGEDDSWDAIWDSAGRIHKNGYTVEIAIPLSVLSFAEIDKQTWGIDLLRFRPRDKRQRISHFPMDRELNCYMCQAKKITGFTNLKPKTNLLVVPSLTASKSEEKTADYDTAGYSDWQDSSEQELSLDVKWGLTQNSTLNLTVNPDFSQIEADSTQLTVNNQYALFFQEKRPFFLEAMDYFNTPINTVYTRSVAAPDFGAKYTSKEGDNTLGFIAGRDSVTNIILPSETYQGSYVTSIADMQETSKQSSDFFIGRYAYDLGNTSKVGGILTHRQGDGYSNTVAGVDGVYRFDDSNKITAQFLNSTTEYPFSIDEFYSKDDSISDQAYMVAYNHNSRDYFIYSNYSNTGQDFRADLGFINQYSFNKFVAGGGYILHGDKNATFHRIEFSGDWDITHDDDDLLLEKEIEAYFSANGPLQSWMRLGGGKRKNRNRFMATATDSNQDFVDSNLYDQTFYSFNANLKPISGMGIDVWANFTKDAIDYANNKPGNYRQMGFWVGYNLTRNLEISTRMLSASLDRNGEGQVFQQDIVDIKANYQFSMRSGLRLTLQNSTTTRNLALYDDPDSYDTESEYLAMQLLYSYKVNPQTVIFAGYADDGFRDDTFTHLEKSHRSLFLKFSYAWMP